MTGVDILFFKGGWGEEEEVEGGRGLGEEGGGTTMVLGVDCIFLSGALGENLGFYESMIKSSVNNNYLNFETHCSV